MPLFLMNFLLFARKNPVRTAQYVVVGLAACLVVWLAVDYSLTKRENRNLEVRLDQLEANYDAARDRIDEFAEAQQRTEAALERIESENAATAAEIKDAVDQLHLEDVEALAAAGASDAAGDLLNRRYRDLQRVLDAATGGAATGP